MLRHSILCSVSLLAMGSAVYAAPATQSGADRIAAAFQAYLGDTQGVVTVAPQGETYAMRVDFAPIVKKFAGEAQIAASVMNYTLTDKGNGTWGVAEDQPLNLRIDIPGNMSMIYNAERMVSEGIFDERLNGFSSQEATLTNLGTQSITFGPEGEPVSTSSQVTQEIHFTSTGVAAVNGGLDMNVNYDATGYSQKVTILQKSEDEPAQEPQSFVVDMAAASYEGDAAINGLKAHEILAALAWVMARPAGDLTEDQHAEIRSMASVAMPGFTSLSTTMTAKDVSLAGPFGVMTATDFGMKMDAGGLVSDGRVHQAFTLKGLSIPAELVPSWAVNLVPSEVSFGVAATGFDLDAPVRALLASELAAIETPEFKQRMGELFLPTGKVHLTFDGAQLRNSLYDVALDGQMDVGPGLDPVGTAVVSASGLDKVQGELAKAPPEVAGQMAMPLAMAMGMARNEGGRLVWQIDASNPGALLINGVNLMGMAQ